MAPYVYEFCPNTYPFFLTTFSVKYTFQITTPQKIKIKQALNTPVKNVIVQKI